MASNTPYVPYKQRVPFEQRKSDTAKVLAKYPDRLPIVVERSAREKLLPLVDRNKFLVPKDLTLGQFLYVIRKRIKMQAETAIFLSINGKMEPVSKMISELYKEHKESDGLLFIQYAGENTFGN